MSGLNFDFFSQPQTKGSQQSAPPPSSNFGNLDALFSQPSTNPTYGASGFNNVPQSTQGINTMHQLDPFGTSSGPNQIQMLKPANSSNPGLFVMNNSNLPSVSPKANSGTSSAPPIISLISSGSSPSTPGSSSSNLDDFDFNPRPITASTPSILPLQPSSPQHLSSSQSNLNFSMDDFDRAFSSKSSGSTQPLDFSSFGKPIDTTSGGRSSGPVDISFLGISPVRDVQSTPVPALNPTPSPVLPIVPAELDSLSSFLEADSKGSKAPSNPTKVEATPIPKPTDSAPLSNVGPSRTSQVKSMGSEPPPQPHSMFGSITASVKGAISSISHTATDLADKATGHASSSEAPGAPGASKAKESLSREWTTECLVLTLLDEPKTEASTFSKAYSYRVCSKTKLPNFHKQVNAVRRSVSDFDYFHDQLIKNYPYLVIPPLPEKKGAIATLVSEDSSLKMMNGLNVFLIRLSRHPTLAKTEVVRLFFELDQAYTSQRKDEKSASPGSLFAGSWFGKSSSPLDPNLRVLRDELNDLERQLLVIKDLGISSILMKLKNPNGASIAQKEKAVAQEYETLTQELSNLGRNKAFSNPVSKIPEELHLMRNFAKIIQLFHLNFQLSSSKAESEDDLLHSRFKSWAAYVHSVVDLIDRLEMSKDHLKVAREKHEEKSRIVESLRQKLRNGGSSTENEKLRIAESDLGQAERDHLQAKEFSEKGQSEIWIEVRRFERAKSFEIAHWLGYSGQSYAKIFAEGFARWAEYAKSLPTI